MAQEDINRLANMLMSVRSRFFQNQSIEVVLEKLLGEFVEVNYKTIYDRLNEYYIKD